MSRDGDLREALYNIYSRLAARKISNDELISLVTPLAAFNTPLRYDMKTEALVAKVSVAGILIGAIAHEFKFAPLSWMGVVGFVLLLATAFISLAKQVSGDKLIEELSNEVGQQIIRNKYGLTKSYPDPETKAAELSKRFLTFHRGNVKRLVPWIQTGRFEGQYITFDFEYFEFRAVSKSKNDNTEEYSQYYYGFVLGKDTKVRANSVVIREKAHWPVLAGAPKFARIGSKALPTASANFNKHYEVLAESPLDVGRILKPKAIIEFEKAAPHIDRLLFEVNRRGEICFSFRSNILEPDLRTLLRRPEQFEQTIETLPGLEMFESSLIFLQEIIRYTDNNFQATKDRGI